MDQAANLEQKQDQAVWTYDFAKHGGAVGDIELTEKLPIGAVCKEAYIITHEDLTSGGAATIALKVASTDDVLAATAYTNFVTTANQDTLLDGTAANMINTAAISKLTVTIAGAAVTAGRFSVVMNWDYVNFDVD